MGLDEAAKKVKSLPATVTAAMQIKTLHHHKKHRHGDNSALLQQEEEAKKKSIEAALDKAKLTLSNMMEETKEEMDKAILTCTEFDSQTVSTLDINKGYRAQLAAQVAEAKGFIAQAKMMISEATTELDSLKTISEEHAHVDAVRHGLLSPLPVCGQRCAGIRTAQDEGGRARRPAHREDHARREPGGGLLRGQDVSADEAYHAQRAGEDAQGASRHDEERLGPGGQEGWLDAVAGRGQPVESSLCGGRRGACEHDYGDLARAGLVQPGRLDGEVHGERESVVPDEDCKRLAEEYERQTQQWEVQLEDNNAK